MNNHEETICQEAVLSENYEEDQIGSRMSTNFISIRKGISVRQAMSELVKQAADHDNVATIYVVDDQDRFFGAIDLKDLIIARESTPLSSFTVTSYPYTYAMESTTDCMDRLKDCCEDSIPVLDEAHKLVGVLTAQDLAVMITDEIEEDYAMLAGLTEEEELSEPLGKSIGKRLPWLIVLFLLGLGVSTVVGLFESIAANLTVLVFFQSLILGMAGNAGTQSLAVTIRVLAECDPEKGQSSRLIWKEARVGASNGILLGLLSFVLIGLYLFLLKGESASLAFSVSACTGLALFFAMLLSGVSGTVIPLVFQKLKIDPAVASGPFITTLNDLVAVVTYYGLAHVLLFSFLAG